MLSTISSNCYRSCVLISFTNLHPFSPFTLSFIFSLLSNFSSFSLALTSSSPLECSFIHFTPCGLSGFSLYGLFFNAHESFLSSLYGYFSFILSYSPTSSFSSLVSFLYQREFKTVVLRLQCQLVLCICSNFDGCSPYTVSEYIWLSKN